VFYKVAVERSADMSKQLPRKFVGNGKHISLVFQDPVEGHLENVDDPGLPSILTLSDSRTNTSCQINKGGWESDHVYLSHDEAFFVAA